MEWDLDLRTVSDIRDALGVLASKNALPWRVLQTVFKRGQGKKRGGTPLFRAASFIQPNGRDNPSVHGRMDRRTKRATHPMEYHHSGTNQCTTLWIRLTPLNCTLKNDWDGKPSNEILRYAPTWMNPEDTVLSEISQSPKDRHCVILLVWGS